MDWQPIDTAPKDGTRVVLRWLSGNEHLGIWRTTYGGEWHAPPFRYLPWSDQKEIVEWRPIHVEESI